MIKLTALFINELKIANKCRCFQYLSTRTVFLYLQDFDNYGGRRWSQSIMSSKVECNTCQEYICLFRIPVQF